MLKQRKIFLASKCFERIYGEIMNIPKFYSEEEITRRRETYTRIWHLKDIGRPALNVWRSGLSYPTYQVIENPELLIESQLNGLEVRSQYKSDCPPFLYPYAGVGILPSAFGCKIILDKVNEPEIEPLLERPEDVYKLQKPKPDGGQMKIVLEQLKYINEANQGYYDIRMHDLQSPFSVASLIWGYEDFMTAVYDYPEEVHHLLNLVTEYIIDTVEVQREVIPNLVLCHCTPDWIPNEFGIAVSDDIAAVVSPKIYEEFAVPYNNILSDYFKGIFIHSCGNSSPNYDTVLKHKNFRGLNFEAADNPYQLAIEKLGGKSLIAPHPGLQFMSKYGNAAGYVRYMLENTPPGVPYIISLWYEMFNPASGKNEVDPSFDEAVNIPGHFEKK